MYMYIYVYIIYKYIIKNKIATTYRTERNAL